VADGRVEVGDGAVSPRVRHRVIQFQKPFVHARPAVLEHLSAQDEALAKIVETLVARMNGPAQG
jgi:hypothetical protein